MRRMHDPKFEKEVQQKLEELSFSPSEAVWTKVERAVNGKKRRSMPLFWLFFLPGLMLVGAGMIYFSGARTTRAVQSTAAVVKESGSRETVSRDAASVPVTEQPVAGGGIQQATPAGSSTSASTGAQTATRITAQPATGTATQSATGIVPQTRTAP